MAKKIYVDLEDSLSSRLKLLAGIEGVSVAELVRRSMLDLLEENEPLLTRIEKMKLGDDLIE